MMLDEIRMIVAEVLRVDPLEVREESRIAVELGADSLDLYQIMMKVEQRYRIHVSERDFYRLYTIGDIIRLIKKHGREQTI
jgi:acyl carrier protein